MKLIKITVSLVLLFFFMSFNERITTLFKNDKVEIYSNKGGIGVIYAFENFEDRETITVNYLIFTAPKKLIGSENYTQDKSLIQTYISKYKNKAVVSNKTNYDIESEEDDVKIVYEKQNNRLVFYYYISKINSTTTIVKSNDFEKLKDHSWHYIGANKFLMDVYIDEVQVLSKHFDLNPK
jgi:hypothetical protein